MRLVGLNGIGAAQAAKIDLHAGKKHEQHETQLFQEFEGAVFRHNPTESTPADDHACNDFTDDYRNCQAAAHRREQQRHQERQHDDNQQRCKRVRFVHEKA